MLTDEQKSRILKAHLELPEACRRMPATAEALLRFESEHAAIPEDFRWYQSECGGGVIGHEWIDGINELGESHSKFSQESSDGGWTLKNFFVIGWDGWGNPYGFDLTSGKIVSEDHDFGGIHVMGESFFDLLEKVGHFQI